MNVEIITIGDELLIGQVIDTNSAFMAVQLNKIGMDVRYKTTVGDNEQDILDAFDRAFSRASIVLVTGGIGPTKDDITKNTLCKYFDTHLVFDEKTLKTIEEVVNGWSKTLNKLTLEQAYVPEKAIVIQNQMGTAPLTWFEKDGKVLVSMPGVPYEMKWAMSNEIIPRLQERFMLSDAIEHQTFWVKNFTESLLAIRLETFENELPAHIRLAYLPTSGLIRLRLTGKGADKTVLAQEMAGQKTQLKSLLTENIISEEDETLEKILDKLLKEKNLTLSLAESCTGGKLASLFTAIPGCSTYFKGGVVSYSNDAKAAILGVNPWDINQSGAVSKEVVEQMVLGAQHVFHSDCAIAVSGIAGPDGGTPEKPVGTVWIAVAYKDTIESKCFHFSKDRENNMLRACNNGMTMLLDLF
ncbi:MAG: Nicotinamide-nucleotide amidohydrolase PncC [Candidatus Ordinivivax streblomastigis]|uniref:CinA-like protein n=1 Tax=Candidatus Ordinivivax streblomastigis TaxID=2540710 RepID=A0A5M8NYN2_9BACT|nr:MAG: Nicotinamide-nucleotide amidohydrolase PncC [Candidatus Ordinivivax streblomastigis]